MGSTKSAKRVDIIKRIMEQLRNPMLHEKGQKHFEEDRVVDELFPYFVDEVTRLYEEYKGLKTETAEARARKNICYTGDNQPFFGLHYMPTFSLQFEEGLKIAVIIDGGETASDMVRGVGNSIMCSSNGYDFVVFLFIDATVDNRISKSVVGDKEARFIEALWFEHNCLCDIV
jgi:hypothetical protein